MSRGVVLDYIWASFGDLGDTSSDFRGSWKQVEILMYFWIPPGSPKAKDTEKLRVKTRSRCPGDRLNQDYQSLVLIFSDY